MRKKAPVVPVDTFYCTLDGWKRSYWFNIDRLKHIEGMPWKEHGFGEYDTLTIVGTIRHHATGKKTRNRAGQQVEIKIWPAYAPRSNWRKDPEAIGSVETGAAGIAASGSLPADAYFSLFPCLASGAFKEVCLRVCNLRYRHGDLDGVDFNPDLSPAELL